MAPRAHAPWIGGACFIGAGAGRLPSVQGPRHAPVPGHPFAVDGAGARALLTIDTGLEVPGGSQDTQQDEFDTQGDRPFDDAYGFNQPYHGAMSMPQMGDPLDLTDSAAFVGNRDARVTSLALTETDTDISTNCTGLRHSTVRSCPK